MLDYDNLQGKLAVNTIKCSPKLRDEFNRICKAVGSDKSEVTRRLWEQFIFQFRENPALRDVSIGAQETYAVKEIIRTVHVPAWKVKNDRY